MSVLIDRTQYRLVGGELIIVHNIESAPRMEAIDAVWQLLHPIGFYHAYDHFHSGMCSHMADTTRMQTLDDL